MSLVIGLGPLGEREATYGANSSFSSVLFCIVAVGMLRMLCVLLEQSCMLQYLRKLIGQSHYT